MKILITGGMGYIGENLKKMSNEFDVCDEGCTLAYAQHLDFVDIKDYKGIVHLAALSGLAACEENPNEAVNKNILTAMNIFGLGLSAQIPVVFTSSQAAKDPQSSRYAFMKWTCEQMAEIYNKDGGSNYVLRLSNVYGGYKYLEKKQTCIKQFITRYQKGYPLIVHGDGEQKRDFIHVDDVCEAIMNCFFHMPTETEPMDIGTGKATSIMELQSMFPRKQNQHYEFKKIRNIGADSSIANTGRAERLIGFKANRKIEDYIKEMI
jgi:UDP-glucose 4-epimerase